MNSNVTPDSLEKNFFMPVPFTAEFADFSSSLCSMTEAYMVSVPLSLLSLKHLQALTSLLRVRNNAEDLKRRHVERGFLTC